tara:strand:+ start:2349 stop:2813 length:465 start_codon:yes stop_codon:yes gene_type:complete
MKYFLLNNNEVRRFVKFCIVGVIGFTIDTGVLNLMVGVLGMSSNTLRLVAKTVAFGMALTSNFFWNRYWIYPESRTKTIRLQAVQFAVVNLIGLALNLLIFGFVSNALIPQFQMGYGTRIGLLIGTNLGQIAAVAVVLFWNFFVNRYWTYSDVD